MEEEKGVLGSIKNTHSDTNLKKDRQSLSLDRKLEDVLDGLQQPDDSDVFFHTSSHFCVKLERTK